MRREADGQHLRLALAWIAALALIGSVACEPAIEQAPGQAARSQAALEAPEAAAPSPTPDTTPTPAASPTPAPTPTRAIRGEFGDAPDGLPAGYGNPRVIGRFPTQLESLNSSATGAHIRNPGADRLGRAVTLESGADDPGDSDQVPNLTNRDGGDDGVMALTVQIDRQPVEARLRIEVTIDDAAPGGARFVNVLIDTDRDGRWSGSQAVGSEWVIRNWPVSVPPGTSATLQSDPFALEDNGQLPDAAWMRVLLTRDEIDGDRWDGSGSWPFGEIEDYQIALPRKAGSIAGAAAVPILSCPPTVTLAGHTLIAGFTCTVVNAGADGTFDARIARAFGGSDLLPLDIAPQDLHAGADRILTFAIVRGRIPAQWRYRTQFATAPGSVEGGVVTMGVAARDQTVSAVPDEPVDDVFSLDDAADYFAIATGEPTAGFGFGDIRSVAMGGARLDGAALDVLREHLWPVGSPAVELATDDFVVVIIEMADDIPRTETSLGMHLGIAIQANDDPGDDWEGHVDHVDLFRGTDQWYEIIYRPDLEPAWRVQRRDAADPVVGVSTAARAFMRGNRLIALLPAGEFARAPDALRYRVTSFVHEHDDPTGLEKPSMADVFPELDAPLAAFGEAVEPRG